MRISTVYPPSVDLDSLKRDRNLLVQALEQAGCDVKGKTVRCEFHGEKNASGTIHEYQGAWLFHCFVCDITYNVFQLIAASRHTTVGKVIENLNETGELMGGLRVASRLRLVASRPAPQVPLERFAEECEKHQKAATEDWLTDLANSLSVHPTSLKLLRCGHHQAIQCACFPMVNEIEQICGLRYRWPDGQKRARTGSKAGIFIPTTPAGTVLWICEGPTDTAALISLGIWAIGLPAARQSIDLAHAYVQQYRPQAVVAVSDAGQVGKASAAMIAQAVCKETQTTKILVPPDNAKDIRDWIKAHRAAGLDDTKLRRELMAAVRASKPMKVMKK